MDVVLTAEEQLVKKEILKVNLLLVWLQTDFTLTNKRIVCSYPNTLMGIIPLGQNQITYPLKNIAGVTGSTKFHFWRFVVGLFLLIFGLKMLTGSPAGGLIMLLLAASLLLNSYTSTFIITNNAGQAPVIELSIIEKEKVAQLVSDINHKIAEV